MSKLIYCLGCGFRPQELKEYIVEGQINSCTPEEFVAQEEGTYDPETGTFLCTNCYLKAGAPLNRDIIRPKVRRDNI